MHTLAEVAAAVRVVFHVSTIPLPGWVDRFTIWRLGMLTVSLVPSRRERARLAPAALGPRWGSPVRRAFPTQEALPVSAVPTQSDIGALPTRAAKVLPTDPFSRGRP